MQKGMLFSIGNKQYGYEIKDKTVELSRTVIPDDAHYLQSVTMYHTLTYPKVVYDVTVNYVENFVEVRIGNQGQADLYSFGEIESFFVDTKEDNYPSTYLFMLKGLGFYVKQLNETEVEFYSEECNTGEKKASRTASYDRSISRILVDGSREDLVLRVILCDLEVYTYEQHDIVSILYWEKKQPVNENVEDLDESVEEIRDASEYYMPNHEFDIKYVEKYLKHNKQKEDIVNHPSHYQSNQGLEVIQVIEAFTEGQEGIEAVCTANVLKYVCRWKKKNGIEDLKKAEWYLKKLIDIKEAESK